MATNFYIQPVGGVQTDIEATYGVRITSVRGLEIGDPKDIYKREWASEHGVDIYIPAERKRKPTEITITFFAEDDQWSMGRTAKGKFNTFIAALSSAGEFDYWDTLQLTKVRCIFEGKKMSWYQFVGQKQLMFEVTLLNPTGDAVDVVA